MVLAVWLSAAAAWPQEPAPGEPTVEVVFAATAHQAAPPGTCFANLTRLSR